MEKYSQHIGGEKKENYCMIVNFQEPKKANSETIKGKIDILLDYIKIKVIW